MSLMSDIATAIKNKFMLNDFYSQSNSLLTGGGTISVSATWEVKWSTRFITVSNGRGAALATGGYFDITMPSVSTVITGVGGAINKTVTANGIPLESWETLYYILPLGSTNTTINANFRVCSYTSDINIPNNWIKICTKNGDGLYVDFACGISLRNNTNINTHLYDVKGADVDGAVSSANTLATARTISASGDIVGTATSFNGSANITIPMTLATIVDSGTGLFKKITTNAKGLVTGTTNVVQSDITGLLGSGSITNTMIANTAVSNLSGTNTGDQTITLTGDITGTGTGSFATALSNSGVTAGTYSKVTVDSKGRITAGMVQTMEDIPDATFKRSVKAATTANITLSGPQTVDGVALVAGDRVLVKNQTTTSQNGIYVVAAGAWTRALDADTASKIASAIVAVDSGTVDGGKLFDNDFKTTDTLGTTAMVWNANLDDGALLTSGSTSIGIVKYNGTTAAAGQFDGGTTTPTGSTRLNYGGYFYPTALNLVGQGDTTNASTHVFVETGSDGFVRPKTLANFKTEMFTSPALSGTPTSPTATVGTNTTQVATTAFVNAEIANDTYSKAQLDAGQLDNRYYTEAEIDTLYNTAVKLTGNQTIAGVKTFSSSPIVPTPTTGTQAANKDYVDNATPAGTIITFASVTAPTGYLKCNGALISRTTYAALFAAIGTTFGAGDGSTTFALPDLRGYFPRGWDDGRGIDTSRVFGSSQDDDFKSHTHSGSIHDLSSTGYTHIGGSEAWNFSGFIGIGYTGGTETRPKNIALLYCIKY